VSLIPAIPERRDASPALVEHRLRRRVARTAVLRRGETAPREDLVAVEEPLEIRLAGDPIAVLMRTPGEDHRLALGYLFGEGILSSAADATSVFHCGRPGEPGYGNVIDVVPASGAPVDFARLEASRRTATTSSACGVCGRSTVHDLLAGLVPLSAGPPVAAASIAGAVAALRAHQPTFAATGATHCAALWARGGALVAAHEDVGRHNAADKVVGALLLARAAAEDAPDPEILAVSGRAGLEIVQKAARARIPVVASVSAPTSLAVELAQRAGVTLAGFVRGAGMNLYAVAERIAL
jgi:FdhD protein